MTLPTTLEEVERHNAKVAAWRAPAAASAGPKPRVPKAEYIPIRERRKRGMNKWEQAYAQHLEALKASGHILWYEFEGIRLRLADGTWFKADFPVLTLEGLEIHEVKGYMREAARVRLNVAADRFPFNFYLVRKTRNGFSVNRVFGRGCEFVPRGTSP